MKQYLVIEIPKNTLFLSTTLGPFGSLRVYYMVTFFNMAVDMNVEKQWIKDDGAESGLIEEIRVKRWGRGVGGIYDGDEEQVILILLF